MTDNVFGEMNLSEGYFENEKTLNLLGRENLKVKILAQVFEDEKILKIQQDKYQEFFENFDFYEAKVPEKVLEYYLNNYDEIIEYNELPEVFDKNNITKESVLKLIKVSEIVFNQDGTYGYLCICAWEPENGLAIQLSPEENSIEVDLMDLLV